MGGSRSRSEQRARAVVLINGEVFSPADAKVSAFDRGYLYGDGVFETLRLYNGWPFRLAEHLARLERSARTLLIDLPSGKAAVGRAVRRAVKTSGLENARIRISVSRGTGQTGLAVKTGMTPTVVVVVEPMRPIRAEVYSRGVSAMTAVEQGRSAWMLHSRTKSANCLSGILARAEIAGGKAFEAIQLAGTGHVAEGTASNIFAVKGNRKEPELLTPPLYLGVLDGITRAEVLRLAPGLGLPCREQRFTRAELYAASECFLTNAVVELVPVVEVDGRCIGEGRPGPYTKRLHRAYGEAVKRACRPSRAR